MLTKRYIVIFAGLGPEKFTEDVLIKTWEDVADRIYLETGIYISARLAMSYMICGDRRGCDLKGPTAEYTYGTPWRWKVRRSSTKHISG